MKEITLAEIHRKERLAAILDRENAKDKKHVLLREPAKYRHTLMSAHGTMSQPLTGEEKETMRNQLLTKKSNSARTVKTQRTGREGTTMKSTARASLPHEAPGPAGYYSHIEHAILDAKANSAWAALTTFNDQISRLEDLRRRDLKLRTQEEQRACLEAQLAEAEGRRLAEAREKERDAEIVAREIEAYALLQAEEEDRRRQKGRVIRDFMSEQVTAAEARRARERAKKKREEEAMAREAERVMEEDKRRKAEELIARREEMARDKALNLLRIAEKKANKEAEKAQDRATAQEYQDMLERQERAREAALAAKHAALAARAERAGEQAVKENREREEKEEAMLRKFLEQKEQELADKAARDAVRRKAIQEDLDRARKYQLELKQKLAADKRLETERFVSTIRAKDREALEQERREAMQRRARNESFKRALEDQMKDKERRRVEDESVMTFAELQLNEQLLREADRLLNLSPRVTTAPLGFAPSVHTVRF